VDEAAIDAVESKFYKTYHAGTGATPMPGTDAHLIT